MQIATASERTVRYPVRSCTLLFIVYPSPLLIVVLDKTTSLLSSDSTNESLFSR
ncbi:MAG: hypothetical protein OJF50_000481 [Nitrospira sp.]|nr:hypothetical protein [Nitrospira sp.]